VADLGTFTVESDLLRKSNLSEVWYTHIICILCWLNCLYRVHCISTRCIALSSDAQLTRHDTNM